MTSSRVRVAMLEAGGWGGIAHYTWNLCEALSSAGADVRLITASPYELDSLSRGFGSMRSCPLEADYGANCRAAWRSATSHDILHIQSTLAARRDWLPMLGLTASGRPWLYTAHNVVPHDDAEQRALGMEIAYDLIYSLAPGVIVHGDRVKRDLLHRFRADPTRVHVIPHGDYGFARPRDLPDPKTARRMLGIPESHRVLLSFGVIRDYKGIPDLIDAFAVVHRQMSDTHLLIAGKPQGVSPDDLTARARALGIADAVTIRAGYIPIPDIAPLFQATDIAVFPYRAIAQSGALQMAYAFARPVVVTRVGALPETVEEGGNGIVVPPSDPANLADGILGLLSLQPEALAAMGRRSAELADARHGWDAAADRTLSLYHRLLDAGSAR